MEEIKSIDFLAKTATEPLCLAYLWLQDETRATHFAALQVFAPGGLEVCHHHRQSGVCGAC